MMSVEASRKIVYLVTEDWAFCRYRLPMARAARDVGFDVVVAARPSDAVDAILAEGFRFVPLSWSRGSLSPFNVLRSIWEIRGLYRRERPDLVHHVAVRPVLLGGVAAWLAGVPAVLNALTGLGTLFMSSASPSIRAVAMVARPMMRFILRRPGSVTLFQNRDDEEVFLRLNLVAPDRTRLIRGSGVDIADFPEMPEPPSPPVVVAFVGRVIADKGVREMVAAYRILRKRGVDIRLLIAGEPDLENPTSVSPEEVEEWRCQDGIELLGNVEDVRSVWARSHIAVLLSRREGLPKSLLEAAAVGRALVATDVPGCREIVKNEQNGLLVPFGDVAAAADALERLGGDADTRRRFGAESRRLVEESLSASIVGAAVGKIYLEMTENRVIFSSNRTNIHQ